MIGNKNESMCTERADHLCLETECGGRDMQWEALERGQGSSFWRKPAGLYSVLAMTSQVYTSLYQPSSERTLKMWVLLNVNYISTKLAKI